MSKKAVAWEVIYGEHQEYRSLKKSKEAVSELLSELRLAGAKYHVRPLYRASEELDDGPGLISCSLEDCPCDGEPIEAGAIWPCPRYSRGESCPGITITNPNYEGYRDE